MTTFIRVLVVTLLLLLPCRTGWAQQQSAPAPREAALKVEADKLLPGAPIRVSGMQAPEQFGVFVSDDAEGLTFYSILVDRNITVAYADVKRIKRGPGGFDPRTGKRKGHKKAIIVTAVVVAGVTLAVFEGGFRD